MGGDFGRFAMGIVIYGNVAASKYLFFKHGIVQAPATMRKKRCTGGGPKFKTLDGRFIGYTEENLDNWASEHTEVVASTSEVGHGKRPGLDAADAASENGEVASTSEVGHSRRPEINDAEAHAVVAENRPDRSGPCDTSRAAAGVGGPDPSGRARDQNVEMK
jgi:hypothetical protein